MFHLFTAESVSCALKHMVFMLKYVSSILTFRFYHKWLLTFVKGFLCIYWDDNMVFIWFVTVLYHINRWILSHPSIPGINLTWSWYVVLLVNPWVSLLIHWGFYIYVYPCYWPATFLFLRFICLVLPAGWCWPQNEFRNIPSSAVFGNVLGRINVNSSLNVWYNSTLKPCDPEFCWEFFLILIQLQYW